MQPQRVGRAARCRAEERQDGVVAPERGEVAGEQPAALRRRPDPDEIGRQQRGGGERERHRGASCERRGGGRQDRHRRERQREHADRREQRREDVGGRREQVPFAVTGDLFHVAEAEGRPACRGRGRDERRPADRGGREHHDELAEPDVGALDAADGGVPAGPVHPAGAQGGHQRVHERHRRPDRHR